MSDEDLAQKVNTEAPWWSKAPIWLAAGIVGVPSLIAISSGYFIAHSVTARLRTIIEYNITEISLLKEQDSKSTERWETMRRLIAINTELLIRNCIRFSRDDKEREECIKGIAATGLQQPHPAPQVHH